jgi:hypothetical protein
MTLALSGLGSLKLGTAFQLLLSGRRDLMPHALHMLPPTKINTTNQQVPIQSYPATRKNSFFISYFIEYSEPQGGDWLSHIEQ